MRTQKVYTNKEHQTTQEINLLPYEHREEMKRFTSLELRTYSHWHRFLETLDPETIGPSLEEYRTWKKNFQGWSYGRITADHAVWQKFQDHKKGFPMNEYYR